MPGLVPGLQVYYGFAIIKDVDGRDKPGHDDVGKFVTRVWRRTAGSSPTQLF
jgi:D-alanyl-D-alanine dipeptidase